MCQEFARVRHIAFAPEVVLAAAPAGIIAEC